MKIKTKVYRGSYAKEGATIALKARLYVSGWFLSGQLKGTKQYPSPDDVVAITYVDDTPICVVSLRRNNVMAFTRKSERSKGYGIRTFEALKLAKMPYYDEGIEGSHYFWRKAINTLTD